MAYSTCTLHTTYIHTCMHTCSNASMHTYKGHSRLQMHIHIHTYVSRTDYRHDMHTHIHNIHGMDTYRCFIHFSRKLRNVHSCLRIIVLCSGAPDISNIDQYGPLNELLSVESELPGPDQSGSITSELRDETSEGGSTSINLAHSMTSLRMKAVHMSCCLSLVCSSAARLCHAQ